MCRRSRYIKLLHLFGRRTAEDLVEGLHATMADLPEADRLALTWDQGSEMAGHDQVARLFAEGVYFAHAGKPWQRPTNENSNGLVRQYFPKSSDLRRKLAIGKTRAEAMRCLKRRISDALYRQLVPDARAAGTGPGGHCGASLTSSAVDLPPHIDTSDQPLPGPAAPTLQPPRQPRGAAALKAR